MTSASERNPDPVARIAEHEERASTRYMRELFKKYVSVTDEFDVMKLRDVVRRECSAAEKGTIAVSRGLLRELRAHRAHVGWYVNKYGGGKR